MPSPVFAALALKAAVAADAVMAEPWLLLPFAESTDPNDTDGIDAARWSGPIAGTFVDPQAKPEMPNGYDRRETRRPGTESGHPRILVSVAAIAAMQEVAAIAGKSATIQQHDLLRRDADGVIWRVATVFPMAAGTLSLGVNIAG